MHLSKIKKKKRSQQNLSAVKDTINTEKDGEDKKEEEFDEGKASDQVQASSALDLIRSLSKETGVNSRWRAGARVVLLLKVKKEQEN